MVHESYKLGGGGGNHSLSETESAKGEATGTSGTS